MGREREVSRKYYFLSDWDWSKSKWVPGSKPKEVLEQPSEAQGEIPRATPVPSESLVNVEEGTKKRERKPRAPRRERVTPTTPKEEVVYSASDASKVTGEPVPPRPISLERGPSKFDAVFGFGTGNGKQFERVKLVTDSNGPLRNADGSYVTISKKLVALSSEAKRNALAAVELYLNGTANRIVFGAKDILEAEAMRDFVKKFHPQVPSQDVDVVDLPKGMEDDEKIKQTMDAQGFKTATMVALRNQVGRAKLVADMVGPQIEMLFASEDVLQYRVRRHKPGMTQEVNHHYFRLNADYTWTPEKNWIDYLVERIRRFRLKDSPRYSKKGTDIGFSKWVERGNGYVRK